MLISYKRLKFGWLDIILGVGRCFTVFSLHICRNGQKSQPEYPKQWDILTTERYFPVSTVCASYAFSEMAIFLLPAQKLLLSLFSETSTSCNLFEILASWQYVCWFLAAFSLCMHRNGCLRASGQNSDTAIRTCDSDFLKESNIFTIERYLPVTLGSTTSLAWEIMDGT